MALEQLTLEKGLNKVEYAITLLKDYEPEEGYYLGFSGGKDSVVTHDIAVKAGVKFDAHYCVSPIDPPEIYSFIREYYPHVIWDYHAWVIIGQQTPVRKSTTPKVEWIKDIIQAADDVGIPVFLKNNLRDLLVPAALLDDIYWESEKAKLRQEFPGRSKSTN